VRGFFIRGFVAGVVAPPTMHVVADVATTLYESKSAPSVLGPPQTPFAGMSTCPVVHAVSEKCWTTPWHGWRLTVHEHVPQSTSAP
jgi:hypothetical protein